MRKLLIPVVMFSLGAAFSLWLLFMHEWPYSPYPQDLLPSNPASEGIDPLPRGNALEPAIPVETDELPAPPSSSGTPQETEDTSQ